MRWKLFFFLQNSRGFQIQKVDEVCFPMHILRCTVLRMLQSLPSCSASVDLTNQNPIGILSKDIYTIKEDETTEASTEWKEFLFYDKGCLHQLLKMFCWILPGCICYSIYPYFRIIYLTIFGRHIYNIYRYIVRYIWRATFTVCI